MVDCAWFWAMVCQAALSQEYELVLTSELGTSQHDYDWEQEAHSGLH